MKCFLFFVAAAFLFAGCGSEPVVRNVADAPGSVNSPISANANVSQGNAADVSARSVGGVAKRMEEKQVVDIPAANRPPLRFEAAADNSEVATTMNPEGLITEIRVFKSHPQIAKIEAVWMGTKVRALKIQLRNGQIREVKTERFEKLRTAPTHVLMELAGLKPPPPPVDPSQQAEKK